VAAGSPFVAADSKNRIGTVCMSGLRAMRLALSADQT
jgi:hypothetical protein